MAIGDKYYLGGQKAFPNYFSGSEIVGKTEIKLNFGFKSNCIKFISNDSEIGTLWVSFGNAPTNDGNSGLNKAIYLNPGEVINDLNIAVTSINLRLSNSEGMSLVRFLVV